MAVAAALVAAVTAVVGVAAMLGVFSGDDAAEAVASCPASGQAVPVVTTAAELDAAQLAIAATIISVANSDPKLGGNAAIIGLIAGIAESGLKVDLPGQGDRDSVGVFQQRPSAGWGTVAEEENPGDSARMFFGVSAGMTADTGLAEIPGWQHMDPGAAAQAVQRSAFPSRYDEQLPLARELVDNARTSGPSTVIDNCADLNPGNVTIGGNVTLPAAVLEAVAQEPAVIQTAIAYAVAQVGKPYIWGGVGPAGYDCSGLVLAAYGSAGVALPHYSGDQYAAMLHIPVGPGPDWWAPLLPGDVIFYEPAGGAPQHELMYLGAGWMVEAPHTGTVIRVAAVYGGAFGVGRPYPSGVPA